MSPLDSKFGFPLRYNAPSLESEMIVEVRAGFVASVPPTNLPVGASPSCQNFIVRDGAIEQRPMLSNTSGTAAAMGTIPVTGGAEIVSVNGTFYPLVSGTTRLMFFNGTDWSVLSYVSANGVNNPPAGSNTSYWDMCQIYDANTNEMLAIMANGSYQTLYTWKSNATVFSSVTGAPLAMTVTAMDNYVLAGNQKDNSGNFLVQRVSWSDRGSYSSWTGGLSGFADLLDMRGQVQRLMNQDNRVIVLGDQEVWQGVETGVPLVPFDFQPFDRSVGCPYPWTAAQTPLGIMFLSRDFLVYLLPKIGGPPQPISTEVQRYLRLNLDQGNAAKSWGVYNKTTASYELFFPALGGSGLPSNAIQVHIEEEAPAYAGRAAIGYNIAQAAWTPHIYDGGAPSAPVYELTRGFETNYSSGGTTWNGMTGTWDQANVSWNQEAGGTGIRAVFMGTSKGTVYQESSTATSDAGTPVLSFWVSQALGAIQPERLKTINQIRMDYQADSASSASIALSPSVGDSFDPPVGLALQATSYESQIRIDVYGAARYPQLKISSTGYRFRVQRFKLRYRLGGR